jgi:hypothetical protein
MSLLAHDRAAERSPGQVAYEAYFDHSAGKSLVSGAPLPTWPQAVKEIRDAWEVAALAVIEECI